MYPHELVLGLLAATSTFLVFNILTTFALCWGTSPLSDSRQEFLACNGAGILGAPDTAYSATLLASHHGLGALAAWYE